MHTKHGQPKPLITNVLSSPNDAPSLAGLDLNLLVVLDALLRKRHVTHAGREVGLSQSATSHALGRLRAHFGDPLLVRDGNTLVPTSRADSLAEPLGKALSTLASAITAPLPFDPQTARRTFALAAADFGQFVVLPPLIERLARLAPGIDLVVRDTNLTATKALGEGQFDLWLGPPVGGVRIGEARATEARTTETGLYARALFDERFVCVVRRDHPDVGDTLDLDTFVALPHAFVAPRGTPGGVVDDVLAERGLTRRVAVTVQHFLVAPWLIAGSNMVITLAERIARAFVMQLPLKVLEPPLPLPLFTIQLTWHERRHRDPGHQWLRNQIIDVCKTV
jgi:DNA-binding transcriptional LysR family regulator